MLLDLPSGHLRHVIRCCLCRLLASTFPLCIQSSNDDLVGSVLLLGLVEDVDRPPRLVGNVRNVEATRLLLANLLDLLKVLFRKLNLLEVLLDARRCDRLGNDAVSANLRPRKNDLCGCCAVLFGDFFDRIVLDEKRDVEHVVTERLEDVSLLRVNCRSPYRVFGDVDVLFLAELDKLGLKKTRVTFDLVGSGCDASAVDESLQMLLGMVGNTDRTSLVL
jgi:hypothetical protein